MTYRYSPSVEACGCDVSFEVLQTLQAEEESDRRSRPIDIAGDRAGAEIYARAFLISLPKAYRQTF